MKLLSTIAFFLLAAAMTMAANKQLNIGEQATHTEVKMLGITDDYASLQDLKLDNGLVVIFSCNTCPFVVAWEDRYNEIFDLAKQNKIGVVLVNSNYMKREGDDSLEAMKKHAQEKGYKLPYLIDRESLLANAWGGQTTPHVFFFDTNFKLVYKGAIDDNYKSASDVKESYLKDAIQSVAAGDAIAVPETKPLGCSIKRKVQND
ncbi:thioredoxin family protein [Mangrovibacterium marinum]|uniref:AhpC/TSA family protein n=1 Tax=Mangrovibacterium marinum TaxID=1639118 RepID=A0A2T5C3B2_9BACT|nr:thioredoxin family protein [Mangrovibacterium marinum]PTN09225.1 AhpC/TSA family protein [Mangrovibacterium marinum]